MPIYEYECCRCHHRFELRQGFDAEPATSCPECQSTARRVLQPVGIVFKGSGFYVTDNRRGGGEQAARKQPKTETTGAEPEAKTETDKPAAEKPAPKVSPAKEASE